LPEPGEASGDPGANTAALKAAILERGITVESVDDLDGALGTSSGGCIRLLNGLSPAMEFTTLVPEYAHELLHHADDRPVAFVVGGAVGLDTAAASRDSRATRNAASRRAAIPSSRNAPPETC
jgi:hypothetical protein